MSSTWVVLVLLGSAIVSAPVDCRTEPGPPTAANHGPLLTTNNTLRASLDRIAAGSALWRSALDQVRKRGRVVLVLTSSEVLVATPNRARPERFDPTAVAEVAPVPRADSQVDAVMVVVNLKLLEELHARQRSLPTEFEADLDRVLVHEIYGHALPYVLSGDLSGRCPDPLPHQRAMDACSIQRENAVRAELRLGRRTDYGLGGLACSRGARP